MEQLKEGLEMRITDIRASKIAEGKMLQGEDLVELGKIGAIVESNKVPTGGEYQGYYFEIDENYEVTVLGRQKGEQPKLKSEITYNETSIQAEIKIMAEISKGRIESIEAMNGAKLKEGANQTETEKTFVVNQNGKYYFKTKADNKRTNIIEVEITKLKEVKLVASNITVNGPAGWEEEWKDIEDLPLQEYSKMMITFSFTAGYDWAFYLGEKDESSMLRFDGSIPRNQRQSSVPKSTEIYELPKDKEYTKLRLYVSSLNAALKVEEVYLIK